MATTASTSSTADGNAASVYAATAEAVAAAILIPNSLVGMYCCTSFLKYNKIILLYMYMFNNKYFSDANEDGDAFERIVNLLYASEMVM
jgi:hypothetical protein